jgi:hypothetical protein
LPLYKGVSVYNVRFYFTKTGKTPKPFKELEIAHDTSRAGCLSGLGDIYALYKPPDEFDVYVRLRISN